MHTTTFLGEDGDGPSPTIQVTFLNWNVVHVHYGISVFNTVSISHQPSVQLLAIDGFRPAVLRVELFLHPCRTSKAAGVTMASYYSRRIYNMQLPGHYRLQRTRGEPVFDVPIGNLQAGPSSDHPASEPASQESTAASVQVPPPSYTGLQLPLVRTTSSGRTLVNPTGSGRRSKVTKIEWSYHPAISGRWYFLRLFRFLRKDREALKTDFPQAFEEVLLEGNVDPAEQEKVRELYLARINHLNEWVLEPLAATRLWMALVEVNNWHIHISIAISPVADTFVTDCWVRRADLPGGGTRYHRWTSNREICV